MKKHKTRIKIILISLILLIFTLLYMNKNFKDVVVSDKQYLKDVKYFVNGSIHNNIEKAEANQKDAKEFLAINNAEGNIIENFESTYESQTNIKMNEIMKDNSDQLFINLTKPMYYDMNSKYVYSQNQCEIIKNIDDFNSINNNNLSFYYTQDYSNKENINISNSTQCMQLLQLDKKEFDYYKLDNIYIKDKNIRLLFKFSNEANEIYIKQPKDNVLYKILNYNITTKEYTIQNINKEEKTTVSLIDNYIDNLINPYYTEKMAYVVKQDSAANSLLMFDPNTFKQVKSINVYNEIGLIKQYQNFTINNKKYILILSELNEIYLYDQDLNQELKYKTNTNKEIMSFKIIKDRIYYIDYDYNVYTSLYQDNNFIKETTLSFGNYKPYIYSFYVLTN
ncbi:hypothetical protein [Mycoplasma sp. P36-A1]|uniref:hypothetical protein n=1 Tax=Mycoplasma sp. P36-A1 TaxID=3252900 RepID=UPI003C2C3D38